MKAASSTFTVKIQDHLMDSGMRGMYSPDYDYRNPQSNKQETVPGAKTEKSFLETKTKELDVFSDSIDDIREWMIREIKEWAEGHSALFYGFLIQDVVEQLFLFMAEQTYNDRVEPSELVQYIEKRDQKAKTIEGQVNFRNKRIIGYSYNFARYELTLDFDEKAISEAISYMLKV